ncbi:MAG: carbohydrate-binding domain-containing protein [Oscillospiraceae bacterium]|nr:carbohydrate-binding domain-containing protein [Oscillospiraceae bacterium]
MSTHKKIDAVCIVVALLSVALTILFMNGEAFGIALAASGDAGDGMFTGNDLDADWDTSAATRITLSDSGSAVSGSGAYIYDGDVYIVYPGRYALTGGLTNGSVIVTASRTDKIWLQLDGAELSCDDDAALRVEQAGKVFLTLAEGSSNMISSGAAYSAEIADSGVDGAIYSRDDLTINGSGSLLVSAAYKHGIVCNNDLVITGGNITISAVQDGIHANDSVRIRDAALSISAGDDGITVSNDDETAFLYVESGSITIPACYEGLEAIDVTIAGGTIDIVSADDGINANGSGAGSVIRVTGGDITVTNPSGRDADGFDSNGSIYIEGGNILISVADSGSNSALDYGSENGGECVISGGTVIACGSSAMAEGFASSSPQGFLMVNMTAAAGTKVSLEAASGQELFSAEIPCAFSSVVLSTPELKLGDVCTLTAGGAEEQVTIDNTSTSGFAAAGMFRGGMRDERDGGAMSGGQQPPENPGQEGGPSGNNAGMRPPEDMQLPEDQAEGRQFPSDFQQTGLGGEMPNRQNGRGGFPGETSDEAAPVEIDGGSVVLLAVSALVLLAGLAIAFKFRR